MGYARTAVVLLAALAIGFVIGCSGSSEEDLTESAAETVGQAADSLAETAGEVVDEVKEMAPAETQAKVDEIKGQIAEKEARLAEIADQLKEISPADLVGDRAKSLQSESDKLTEEIKSLKEKLQPYVEKLGN